MAMDTQTIALIFTLVGMAATGVWKLSRVETALRGDITASKEEVEEKQSQHSREFGETIAALRQYIANVELYGANNYVRRDGFDRVQTQINDAIEALGDKIESRLVRLETKIDTKT